MEAKLKEVTERLEDEEEVNREGWWWVRVITDTCSLMTCLCVRCPHGNELLLKGCSGDEAFVDVYLLTSWNCGGRANLMRHKSSK